MTAATGVSLARLRTRAAPPLVPLLVGAILLLSMAGCLSTDVAVGPGEKRSGCSFRVVTYPDADAAQAGHPESPSTLVELFRLVDGKELFLQRSLAGRWGVDGLPPGDYRVRVVAVLDEQGNIQDPRSGDRETDFSVRDGEAAQVRIVLKKTPVGLIVIAALTVVILIVAVVLLAKDDFDIPTPPSPGDLLAHLPPPPHLDHIVFCGDFYFDLPIGGPGADAESPESRVSPRVTSTFPPPGALVAARRIAPSVTFSQEIDTSAVGPKSIRMLGSKSGLFTGRTVIRQGLLRFEPDIDLSPREVVTVTVAGEEIENGAGRQLEKDFSWSFRVAP